jgi:hypothetical protein
MSRPGPDRPAAADPMAPPGWRDNPSSWPQRLPIVAVAAVGFAIATYLTLFQVGVLGSVWEPFFGDGSRTVLGSSLSRVLPVPTPPWAPPATCSTPSAG